MSVLKIDEARLIEFSKSVELIASRFLEGSHRSARGGEGLEFHSYLPYAEGEDVRRIDWRRLASSDRLYVRKFEREEKLGWAFLVDNSQSMNFEKKAELSQLWAGVGIFLARLWADSWHVYPDIDGDVQEAYSALASGAAGMSPINFTEIQPMHRSRLVVLSDFFFDLGSFTRSIEFWKQEFHSIHLVQVLSPEEMDFPWRDVVEFQDLESTDRLLLDARVVRSQYLAELKSLQENLRSMLREEDRFHVFKADLDLMPQHLAEFFEQP